MEGIREGVEGLNQSGSRDEMFISDHELHAISLHRT
jgi:hypothetical protein